VACNTKANDAGDQDIEGTEAAAVIDLSDEPDVEALGEGEPEEPYLLTKDDTVQFEEYYGKRIQPPPFSFDHDLESKKLEELRQLRNEIFARKGYLFKDATLRGYFNSHDWYQPIFWREVNVKLSSKEMAFIEKVREQEKLRLAKNYTKKGSQTMPNTDNLANLSQFDGISSGIMNKVGQNGFCVVPAEHIQLFHVYEDNDYRTVPSFITTDLYLQVLHIYFSFLLQDLEQDNFIPLLEKQVKTLYEESKKAAQSAAAGSEHLAVAEYSMAYYAIALKLLKSNAKISIPSSISGLVSKEVANVNSHKTMTHSPLNDEPEQNYSLFKPRGHYTRSKGLERYFRAMMWLQSYPVKPSCMILTANIFQKKPDLLKQYMSIYEPTSFIVGESDNVSLLDAKAELSKGGYPSGLSSLLTKGNIDKLVKKLSALNKERIKPKGGTADAQAKLAQFQINYMPSRYLFDGEILQRLIHVTRPNPKRTFPKGLDVFATLGNKAAENILLKEYKEAQNWGGYDDTLKVLQKQFASFNQWDKTVYNKWMYGLKEMCKPNSSYPYFMQNDAWARKNLNTALGSWAELKHDVILYAEQPMAAECGGWGPEEPVLVGYVEPNVSFWKNTLQLLDLNEKGLAKYGLNKGKITDKTKALKELATFLLKVSEKELQGKRLSDQEYDKIRTLGSDIEYTTLQIMDVYADDWSYVDGPDRSVAIVADVYTYNSSAMEVAVGNADEIFVAVEVNGLIYLMKGAVFSYYEFKQDANNRLTDEEWQEMLKNKQAPKRPKWTQPFKVEEKAPKVKEGYIYSSGC